MGIFDFIGSGFDAALDGISDLGDIVKKVPGGDLVVGAINIGAKQLEDFARTDYGKFTLYYAANLFAGPTGIGTRIGTANAGLLGGAAASTIWAVPGMLRCQDFGKAYAEGVMLRAQQAVQILGDQFMKQGLSPQGASNEATKFLQNQLKELENLFKNVDFRVAIAHVKGELGDNIPSYTRGNLANLGIVPDDLARKFNTSPLVIAQALNATYCRNIYEVGPPIPGLSEFDERGEPWSGTKERETLAAARQELLDKAQALGTRITGTFYRPPVTSPEVVLNAPSSSPWATRSTNPLPSAKEVSLFVEALKSVGAQSRTLPQDPRLSTEADRLQNLYETRLGSNLPQSIFATGTPPDVFLAFTDRANSLRARSVIAQTRPPGSRSERDIAVAEAAAANAERAVNDLPPMQVIPGGTSAPGDFIQAATVQMNRLCHAAYDARQIGQAPAIVASLERQCRAAGGRPMPRPTGGRASGGSATPAGKTSFLGNVLTLLALTSPAWGSYLYTRYRPIRRKQLRNR